MAKCETLAIQLYFKFGFRNFDNKPDDIIRQPQLLLVEPDQAVP